MILLWSRLYFFKIFLLQICEEKPHFRTFQKETEILQKSELTTPNILGDTALQKSHKVKAFTL